MTVNATRYIAGEIELTHQPEDQVIGGETHTVIALKGIYRAEQKRWLKFAGINFFGVAGPAFINRSYPVANPDPPPYCLRCTVQRRQTTDTFEFGGGIEIVPARALALRFDATHMTLTDTEAYFSESGPIEIRNYLKIALMFRFP